MLISYELMRPGNVYPGPRITPCTRVCISQYGADPSAGSTRYGSWLVTCVNSIDDHAVACCTISGPTTTWNTTPAAAASSAAATNVSTYSRSHCHPRSLAFPNPWGARSHAPILARNDLPCVGEPSDS